MIPKEFRAMPEVTYPYPHAVPLVEITRVQELVRDLVVIGARADEPNTKPGSTV